MSNRLHRDELILVAALAAANIVLNRLVPGDRSREIPAHVATAAAMVAVAGIISPPAADEGAVRDNWRQGVATGLAIGVPIGTALTLAPSLPLTRRFFHDE